MEFCEHIVPGEYEHKEVAVSVPAPYKDSQRGFVYRPPTTDNRLIVPGEYEHVALASGNTTLLREAHATPCTRGEARALLMELAGLHGVSRLVIRFTSRRGRAGYVRVYCREPWVLPHGETLYCRRFQRDALCVWLPRVPMEPGGDWYARLRVGLVLHEFAHLLADDSVDYDPETGFVLAGPDHGPSFVMTLDKLVAWWAESRRAVAPQTKELEDSLCQSSRTK